VGLFGLFKLPWPLALVAVALYVVFVLLFIAVMLIITPLFLLVAYLTSRYGERRAASG
jgi:hypothetical protein